MSPDPDSPPRWSVERRLSFIAERLGWEGRINRADLVARFGISPNQATADLKRFAEANPGALHYDIHARTYTAGRRPLVPDAAAALRLLQQLQLVAEGVMPATDALLSAPIPVDTADLPPRRVSPGTLAAVIAAIQKRQVLLATYQSFSTPEPRPRLLEPHALVFDGFRWHARARDAEEDLFKDFVLGRLSHVRLGGEAQRDPMTDTAWNTCVTLVLAPHPGLSPNQRAAIAADYGMRRGRLSIRVREATLFYAKRRLGLTEGHEGRRPEDQHIVLVAEDRRGVPPTGASTG